MKNAAGVWQGYGLGDTGAQVTLIQTRLIRAYGSYSVALGVRETGIYDQPTADAISEFQRRVGFPVTGIANYATQVRMGVVAPAPKHLTQVLAVPGTWGSWSDGGPQNQTAWGVDPNRFRWQGVGYNTGAFLTPDPMHSYIMARTEGAAELLRLSLPDPTPKVWVGYSMGADVVTRALLQWPADRQHEIACVVKFGDPGRAPGPTLFGEDPGGAGISGVYTPDWAKPVTYDFTIAGDMYANATGLLPQLYDILTHLDMGIDFFEYLFQILISTAGGQLLGTVSSGLLGAGALSGILGLVTPGPASQTTGAPNLAAMLLNIPGIISALMTALQFLITGAHGHYGDEPEPYWGGLTGVQKAIQIIDALPL